MIVRSGQVRLGTAARPVVVEQRLGLGRITAIAVNTSGTAVDLRNMALSHGSSDDDTDADDDGGQAA